jgi:hypothetical protein
MQETIRFSRKARPMIHRCITDYIRVLGGNHRRTNTRPRQYTKHIGRQFSQPPRTHPQVRISTDAYSAYSHPNPHVARHSSLPPLHTQYNPRAPAFQPSPVSGPQTPTESPYRPSPASFDQSLTGPSRPSPISPSPLPPQCPPRPHYQPPPPDALQSPRSSYFPADYKFPHIQRR